METNKTIWVLLDDEGEVIRKFDYPAEGTIEIKPPKKPKFNPDDYEECLL